MKSDSLHALSQLNLSGVAMTAEVGADETLQPVGGQNEKLSAALFEKSFPRIHTVIVAKDQALDTKELVRETDQVFRAPASDLQILRAGSVAEAVQLLEVNDRNRWSRIDCTLPPLNPDFVGREQLTAAVQDFVANHESGYLVLVGGMGKGKSTFLSELIHTEQGRKAEPIVFHIVGYHPSDTGNPQSIAACLYDRLRRKYVFPEPSEWKEAQVSNRVKLEHLLRHISENGNKEVLYIDAADQAESSSRDPLLPGTLPNLPLGVVCVITSRTQLDWLQTMRSVTVWELDEYTDDRADIQIFLQQRASFLSKDFIEQIITQPDPPVFYTVAATLRKLEEQTAAEAERDQLHTDPTLWCLPPEELIQTEALRRVAEAEAAGISQTQFWQTLGILALAGEDLSQEQLDELGLWEDGTTDRVLQFAANFFKRRSTLHEPQTPYQFDHPGYYREVVSHLTQRAKRKCHQLLANGCAQCWRDPESPARDYALQFRLSHLIAAQAWEQVAEVFAEADFIVARSERFDFSDIHADARSITEHPSLSPDWKESFSQWERFLRLRIGRLRSFPQVYGQEVVNEFLTDAPGPLRKSFQLRQDRLCSVPRFFLQKTVGQSALRKLEHQGYVWDQSISADGRRVATGSSDGTVKVWDAETGEMLTECIGHTGAVHSVAISADGRRVASSVETLLDDYAYTLVAVVKVWDVETGAMLGDCIGHIPRRSWVAISADGRRVVSVSPHMAVRVWDAETGEVLVNHAEHKEECCEARPADEHWVALDSRKTIVTVWDAVTGDELAKLVGHKDKVCRVAISADGRWVVSASRDADVKVWDVEKGTVLAEFVGDMTSIAISTDGWWAISGSDEGIVKVWDTVTGKILTKCVGYMASRHISEGCAAISADGRRVVSGSDEGIVKVWDTVTGDELAKLVGHKDKVCRVAISADGRRVVSGSDEGIVKVWDTVTGKILATRIGYMASDALSADGEQVVSRNDDRAVEVWDTVTGEVLATRPMYQDEGSPISISANGRRVMSFDEKGMMVRVWDIVSGNVFANFIKRKKGYEEATANGRWIVSVSDDGNAKAWDAFTGNLLTNRNGHMTKVSCMAISADGRRVAFGSHDGTVKVRDTVTGAVLTNGIDHILSIAISADGRRAVSSNYDGTVKVWDTVTGAVLANGVGGGNRFGRDNIPVRSVAISADGRRAASGCDDGVVKVWDTVTGAVLAECVGHSYEARSVAISADGRRIVSSCYDPPDGSILRTWDGDTGESLADWVGHRGEVKSTVISADGRWIVSGSDDGTVRAWEVATGQCINELHFDDEVVAVSLIEKPPSCLIVVLRGEKTFVYELVKR